MMKEMPVVRRLIAPITRANSPPISAASGQTTKAFSVPSIITGHVITGEASKTCHDRMPTT